MNEPKIFASASDCAGYQYLQNKLVNSAYLIKQVRELNCNRSFL